MDVLTGDLSNPVTDEVTFSSVNLGQLPQYAFPVENYSLIAMNYLLAGSTVNVALNFNAESGLDPVEVSNTAVKRNFRTNIYGSLLTDPANFKITINNKFDGSYDNGISLWDGESSEKPEGFDDPEVTEVPITTASELAYVMQNVNANNNMEGKTLNLETDVDFNGETWNPIVNFKGDFEGNGKTISNLDIAPKTNLAVSGIFGSADGATISDLIIEDVSLTFNGMSGAGIIGGQLTDCTIKNITVKGTVQITYSGNGGVGALIGYCWSGTTAENITIDVTEDSFVKSTGSFAQGCGGVFGQVDKGSTFKNIKSNINVIALRRAGGIVGSCQGNTTFTECSSSGTVTVNATSNANAQLIGGIIGEASSLSATSQITLTGCAFTGTLAPFVNGNPYTLTNPMQLCNTTTNVIIN